MIEDFGGITDNKEEIPMWMTFFLRNGHTSRTELLKSYDEALEAARRGPSGAMFFITHLAKDPNDDVQVLEGYVP